VYRTREFDIVSSSLLNGRRGVITGVANERSIAWACALACKVHGTELAFTYLGESQEKRVRALVDEHAAGSLVASCDVTKDAEIAAYFDFIREKWGRIDFLVHSIAYADRDDLKGRYLDTPRDHFALALDISAYSLVALARAAEPLFPESGGSIVAMTYYGAEKVVPKYNVMGVAKAALEAGARYLAQDLGPRKVRVNCISAGPLRTLSSAAFPGFRQMLRLTELVAPLRRNITQDDVAASCVYLLSDLASGVTGEVLHVDSGYHILGMAAPPEESA
jgi:enoyl-[acyl-carrier protein] reductase I